MNIIENPNPTPTRVFTCGKCSCKFECRDSEIKHEHGSDANGRLGGTHHWSSTSYVNCPNCGERIVVARKSGYGSSVIDDQHVTEDWSVIEEGNTDDLPDTIKGIINAK